MSALLLVCCCDVQTPATCEDNTFEYHVDISTWQFNIGVFGFIVSGLWTVRDVQFVGCEWDYDGNPGQVPPENCDASQDGDPISCTAFIVLVKFRAADDLANPFDVPAWFAGIRVAGGSDVSFRLAKLTGNNALGAYTVSVPGNTGSLDSIVVTNV